MLKSKKFWAMLAVLIVLPFGFSVHAETPDTTSKPSQIVTVVPAVTGYIVLDPAVNAGDDHELRFAVLKTSGTVKHLGTWQVQFDFANLEVVAAQFEHKQHAFGGTFQYYIGKVFTGAGQITVAPNDLYAPNWSSAHLPFTFIGDGAGVQYTNKGLDIYAVTTNRVSAAATYKGFEALWEDSVGTEVGYATPFAVLGQHPSMRSLFFEDHGVTQNAAGNWFSLGNGVRCYQLTKWGRSKETCVGLTYDVENLRLKGFYNFRAETYFAEVICSF